MKNILLSNTLDCSSLLEILGWQNNMPLEVSSSAYLLWSGPCTLRYGNAEASLDCQVYQQLKDKGGLLIQSKNVSPGLPHFFVDKSLRLDILGIQDPIDVTIIHCQWSSEGVCELILKPLRTPCWYSKSLPLRSGRFVILNFAHYWMGHPKKLNFTLKAVGWIAQFIAVTRESLSIPSATDNEDFRITHQVEFRREDDSVFTEQQAKDFLSKMSLFLSFCHGHWVGYSLMAGLDENCEVSLEQWGTGRASRWHEPSGWLDEHHGNCIVQLYERFSDKLEQRTWLDAINHVVYWFSRADTNNVGPDGACILLQAALERLAWHILVRERRALSEKGFRDLTAADQLRLMLNILSIPTAIPPTLVELKALGLSRTMDGPEIFTYIRNRLTHPPKISASKEQLPYYDAYSLAQSYVELAILSSCEYCGEYGGRTTTGSWKGQVEKVPWA